MSIIFARLSVPAVEVSSRSAFICFIVSSSIAFTWVTWSGVRFSCLVRKSTWFPLIPPGPPCRGPSAGGGPAGSCAIAGSALTAVTPSAKIATCNIALRNIVIFIEFSLSSIISPESSSPVVKLPVQTHLFQKGLRA